MGGGGGAEAGMRGRGDGGGGRRGREWWGLLLAGARSLSAGRKTAV